MKEIKPTHIATVNSYLENPKIAVKIPKINKSMAIVQEKLEMKIEKESLTKTGHPFGSS